MTHPRRGEVWWVSFDPAIGGEIQKTRPAIIISNNAANSVLNRVIVIPITSKADRVYPGEALVEINGQQSKAMSDQITTASKIRLRNKLGALSNADLNLVEDAMLFQLGMRRRQPPRGRHRMPACFSATNRCRSSRSSRSMPPDIYRWPRLR